MNQAELLDNETKQKIINLISTLVPQAKIYLFGSRARQTHGKWSDIDLAIDAGKPLSFATLDEVKSVLEATNIPFKIDVVDMHYASDDMRAAIQKEGIAWKQ